jgi:hypothetical protein
MFSRGRALATMAAMSLGVAGPSIVANVQPVAPGRDADEVFEDSNRRSKGKQAKPKKRPNRLTISKRVRRKHRKARR